MTENQPPNRLPDRILMLCYIKHTTRNITLPDDKPSLCFVLGCTEEELDAAWQHNVDKGFIAKENQ